VEREALHETLFFLLVAAWPPRAGRKAIFVGASATPLLPLCRSPALLRLVKFAHVYYYYNPKKRVPAGGLRTPASGVAHTPYVAIIVEEH
jgi:hypothetical protein